MDVKNTNRLIDVDLTSNAITVKDIPVELIRRYVGGRGINSYLLYQYTSPATGLLSPDNVLIVGTGILTGLKGFTFSRTTITARSPESGLFGDANIGGGFGVNLRRLGFGYIVVRGAAPGPVMVVIDKTGVRIEDAGFTWGCDTQDAQEKIYTRYPGAEALVIGPAGEKKVVFSCIINRVKNAAARCGMGAVMGSKNVKAIVACGDGEELALHDECAFYAAVKEVNAFAQNEFLTQRLKEFGSSHLFEIVNESICMGRVRNGRTLAFSENQNISHKNLKTFHQERRGCKNCVIRCHFSYEYQGHKNEGPEYGVMAHFGPVLGIGRLEDTLILNDVVNRLGLDASSSANIIAWAIELYQEGLLTKDMTDGQELVWSDAGLVQNILEKIARREGFGDFCAAGPRAMLARLPKGAERFLCWTKQLVQSEPADLRVLPAFALSNAVASRGSDHLRSRPIWVAFEYPPEALKEFYGVDVDSGALTYGGKGHVVRWWEEYLAMFDMTGMCKFMGVFSLPPGIRFEWFSKLMCAATGIEVSADQLRINAERLINIERAYLEREGISRKDDYPTPRVFEPLCETAGMREEDKTRVLNRQEYDTMLSEFYDARGWTHQGCISKKTRERLLLDEVIGV